MTYFYVLLQESYSVSPDQTEPTGTPMYEGGWKVMGYS